MCDCVKNMNERLATLNVRIAQGLFLTPTHDLQAMTLVATEKVDKAKRKPLPAVVANFCPFCGEKQQ